MNNGKTPLLDLQYNVQYNVEIVGYKFGTNTYGPWFLYKLNYNGEQYAHFAQPLLH